MEFEAAGREEASWRRERTLSNMSQPSSHCSKMNFPLMTSDSGLYTCSSNNSDSAPFESDTDTDSCHFKAEAVKNDSLQLALQEDTRRLRSELERLTKSEQWYKQELRQQKSIRLEDLERIYTQERKFLQDNQRLQRECVRLYEKCNEFERELQRQRHESESRESSSLQPREKDNLEEDDITQFEVQQQSALIKDQQQLISVLRKQKKALLNDMRSLTEEKDEKVMEMQRLLADLEFDNKRITKKCTDLSKERSNLERNIKKVDSKLSLALDEKLSLQKSLLDLREQLELQEKLVKLKEDEISKLQIDFKDKMRNEHDLDEVHRLSINYHEEINSKSLEIIALKSQLSNMQDELENLQQLQVQNDEQQRLIEQLNFSLEVCQLELQEIKASEILKSAQIEDLQDKTDKLLQDKEDKHQQLIRQEKQLVQACQELKKANDQYSLVQERSKETQFKLELLEIEQSKLRFQTENDRQEIQKLRQKLKEYLRQTSELGEQIHTLEANLKKTVQENVQLKSDLKRLQQELSEDPRLEANIDKDFLELSEECERLQNSLDAQSEIAKETSNAIQYLQEQGRVHTSGIETIQESEDRPDNCRQDKAHLLKNIPIQKEHSAHHLHQGMRKLVNENEILKKKISQIEMEAASLQLKQDIYELSEKCALLQSLLDEKDQKVKNLRNQLLANDSKLYKIERHLKIAKEAESDGDGALQEENRQLRTNLAKEQCLKTDLNEQLTGLRNKVESLTQTLEQFKSKQRLTSHKAVQCDIDENQVAVCQEVDHLKGQLLDLQSRQLQYAKAESHKREERLQLLHKLSEVQNSKMQCLEESRRDWEDMLKTVNTVQATEEQTRRELELKRMELEELNQVFAEQNEELRKLEQLTALMELKRQSENEQLKQTFQQEIHTIKQQLLDSRQEMYHQQELNHQLQLENDRIRQNYNEDYATEVADFTREVRALQQKVGRSSSEKDDMMERIRELEQELKEIKNRQREAILLPTLSASTETSITDMSSDLSIIKSNVSEDHLRILTKVLEAEYSRKMQRYDEHIHSLLSNVKALKNALRQNEEKTAQLNEEQCKTLIELKELQQTKRNLEDIRFKYEQSQNTIKELKQTLAMERKKFESSDLGKSSQNQITTYEVANLIDDYKKLIQQSAFVTKRPPTSSILDLIQRSNQCVPNLQKLESNIGDLRCDLQNFLSSYTQKIPVSSLIATASLTVPPSLMDELKAASTERF